MTTPTVCEIHPSYKVLTFYHNKVTIPNLLAWELEPFDREGWQLAMGLRDNQKYTLSLLFQVFKLPDFLKE